MLLTDKYFPKSINEFIGNKNARMMVENFIKSNNIPNIIIVGSHGIGKTTLCTILLEEYFRTSSNSTLSIPSTSPSVSNYEHYSLIIRGSIDRGKDMVSEYSDKKKKQDGIETNKCSAFISKTLRLPEGKIRIIIVYDFEKMTENAKQTLKAIIEEKSGRVRFIFICNDINNIEDAIQSRATPIEMFRLTKEEIVGRLKEIVIMEKGSNVVSDKIYDVIHLLCDGDLKKSINYIQIYLNSLSMTENCIYSDNEKLDSFYNIFNIPHISIITSLILSTCVDDSTKNLSLLIRNGFNCVDILEILVKVLISSETVINEEVRIKNLTDLSDVYKKYIISPAEVHLYDLVCRFVKNSKSNIS